MSPSLGNLLFLFYLPILLFRANSGLLKPRTPIRNVNHNHNHNQLPQTVTKPLVSYDINLPYSELCTEKISTKYPEYLPTWDPVWYNPLPLFHFEDPALRVKDKSKPQSFTEGVTIQHIQPRMGSIVTGLQLNKLSDAAKDELALLISERKVLAFPEQDLIDAGPAAQHDFMKYFGKLNYQPVSGTVKGYPGFTLFTAKVTRMKSQSSLSTRLQVPCGIKTSATRPSLPDMSCWVYCKAPRSVEILYSRLLMKPIGKSLLISPPISFPELTKQVADFNIAVFHQLLLLYLTISRQNKPQQK